MNIHLRTTHRKDKTMINNYNDHIGIVFPISNKVLLPDVLTTVRLEALGEAQMKYLEDEDAVKIALPQKQNFGKNPKKEEDFYRTGVIFEVTGLDQSEKGILLSVKFKDRVNIKELQIENGIIYAQYELSPDHGQGICFQSIGCVFLHPLRNFSNS